MKHLIFVCQSKGGSGKSILSYLLAEKYQEALVVDMDDATRTTTKNLAYRNPLHFKFLNQSNTIDRGAFDEFLESVSSSEYDLIICDMGASVSEQLPFYLEDNCEVIVELLKEAGIKLEIYCVVGGGNLFSSTMGYFKNLVVTVKKRIPITVFKNDYFWFSESQEQEYLESVKYTKLPAYSFTVSKDRNEVTQNRIREVLETGAGIKDAKMFSKAYFTIAMKKLPDLSQGDVAEVKA